MDSITWHWEDNSDDESGFHVHDSSENAVGNVEANVVSCVETGLNENTQYERHSHAYAWTPNPETEACSYDGDYINYHSYRSWGFQFTPTSDIDITKLSRYAGLKASVHTDSGTLLFEHTFNTSTYGLWVEEELGSPLALSAGRTYRVSTWDNGSDYTYCYDPMGSVSPDPNITVNSGCNGSGQWPSRTNSGYVYGLVNFKFKAGTRDYSNPSNSDTKYTLVHDATTDDFELALGLNPGEVDITITPPPNVGLDMTGVKVERATNNTFTADLTTVQDFADNYSLTDSGLTSGTTYWYRITYCNGDDTPSAESDGESIDIPVVIDAPVAEITDPTGGIWSGDVTITYTLTDPTSDLCSITVECSVEGGPWNICTEIGGSGTIDLTSSDTGVIHTFIWDTVNDGVGLTVAEAVEVRITPSDAAETGTPDTTSFTVSNVTEQPPVADITDPTGGIHSGNITITYTLSDIDSDTCGTTIEWSPDGSNWNLCTSVSSVNPASGLTSSPAGETHAFNWDSAADSVGTGGDESIQFMITPWDKDGEGTADTVTFTVNNEVQQPPSVTITDPIGGTYVSDVTIVYTLTDVNSDQCDVTVEYTTDSGGAWNPCTEGTSGNGVSGLDSSPTGIVHTFVWDTVADDVGTAVVETVKVRITPDDGVAGSTAESSEFTVDNTGAGVPQADFSGTPRSGPASLVVDFTDTSRGTYDSWAWDFNGNGTIDSTERNPSYEYRLVGTYTVRLTIDGSDGSASETKVDYITVIDSGTITAEFNADPRSGLAPLEVQFTDKSVGDIASWLWEFGDGATSAERNPAHQYTSTGFYTVSLTVTGTAGSHTETKTGYISVTEGASDGGDKDKGGCSCTVDRRPAQFGHMLGYFLPVIIIVCVFIALRRREQEEV
jgi:PKD repeat protein